MAEHVEGTFTVSAWEENTYAELEGKGKLTKATVTFDFTGDLTAQGTWDAVMCYRPDGTAVFTGFQRMSGQVSGRSGTFVARADGTFSGGEARTEWEVVDGSGTGALARIRGSGSAVSSSSPGGTFSLDYDLG
jgi:Protein of unknown function (DUF3224)